MAIGPLDTPAGGAPAIVERYEPQVVEVVVHYPFGAADEAVAAAAATVQAPLDGPSLGAATADTPQADDDSPRVATTAMVQAVARAVLAETAPAVRRALAQLLTTPAELRALLPAAPPDTPDTPWLSRDALAVTPGA